MEINLIAAIGDNNELGFNNGLPWNKIREDFAWFKKTTENGWLIAGRKTVETLPKSGLPGRQILLLSTNTSQANIKKFNYNGNVVLHSLESAITWANLRAYTGKPVFIIGGAQVYKEALEADLVDNLYLAHIHGSFKADTFFPELDMSKWEVKSEDTYFTQEYTVTNFVYARKRDNIKLSNDKSSRNREGGESLPNKFNGFALQGDYNLRRKNYSY